MYSVFHLMHGLMGASPQPTTWPLHSPASASQDSLTEGAAPMPGKQHPGPACRGPPSQPRPADSGQRPKLCWSPPL